MWTYSQSTGELTRYGVFAGTGYSGNGAGLNNPEMQAVKDVGPLPQGIYTIGPAQLHPHMGPITMELVPAAGNEMFGRSGFFIHGDNREMNHTASEGCLVIPDRLTRAHIAIDGLHGEHTLEVTA